MFEKEAIRLSENVSQLKKRVILELGISPIELDHLEQNIDAGASVVGPNEDILDALPDLPDDISSHPNSAEEARCMFLLKSIIVLECRSSDINN